MDGASWSQQMGVSGGSSFSMAGLQGPMSNGSGKGGFSPADKGGMTISGAAQGPGMHQCQLCGSGMNSKRLMLSHLKECSESQMKALFEAYQCLQCRNAFLSRELLLVHVNTCAAEQLEQVIQIETMQAMQAAQAAQIKQEAAVASAKKQGRAETFPKAERDDDATSSQGEGESLYGGQFNGDGSSEEKNRWPRKRSYSPMKNEGEDNQHPCNVENCDKSFSSQNILKNHNDTAHLGKSNNQCGLCGKKFTTAHSMKSHDESVHQGKKNYKCDSCEICCSTKSDLRNTMKQFIKESDTIAICVRRVSLKNSLNFHKTAEH